MGSTKEELLAKIKARQGGKIGFWENIKPRIKQGHVIPIISNSFRIEHIFKEKYATLDKDGLTPYEQLTRDWAGMVEYPMDDGHDLARVAQYYLVNIQKDRESESQARTQYLEFLKSLLLVTAEEQPKYANKAARLLDQIQEKSFSEIAAQLDYPRFPENVDDPLGLLAQLPLPIYLTTSQSDFLERALTEVGRAPKTQICFWSGEISTKPEHKTDPDFIPTKDTPLVYHLFGFEDYPQTLVLSEDDYINFLISVVENKNTQNPIIPSSLRLALGGSQLILLGYRLQDWDFRVLFRFIQKFERSDRGMVVQLKPSEKENLESLEKYLKDYFDIRKFDIDWNTADDIVQKLWSDWNVYEQSQSS